MYVIEKHAYIGRMLMVELNRKRSCCFIVCWSMLFYLISDSSNSISYSFTGNPTADSRVGILFVQV